MTSPICYVCDAPTIKTCQRCSTIYYCSKECQQSDRASHSEYCASIRGGEREIWGLESIREIAQNPVEELVMHRKLLQDAHASELSPKGLYKEEKDIVDFFKKSQGKNGLYVACMIFDLYSSEVLPSYNIILDMLGEAESMDHEAFIASVCIGREDKKRGDSHFICIRNGCCDYYACLVRCPYRGGTQQKYRVFQSYFPHYGLKEWMEDPSATDVDKYLTRIEEIVTQGGCTSKLSNVTPSSILKHGHSLFYFRKTTFSISDVYTNALK